MKNLMLEEWSRMKGYFFFSPLLCRQHSHNNVDFFAYMFNTNNKIIHTSVSFFFPPRISCSWISFVPVYWIYFEEFVPRAILLWLGSYIYGHETCCEHFSVWRFAAYILPFFYFIFVIFASQCKNLVVSRTWKFSTWEWNFQDFFKTPRSENSPRKDIRCEGIRLLVMFLYLQSC